jgi:pilus assembly protein CpaD
MTAHTKTLPGAQLALRPFGRNVMIACAITLSLAGCKTDDNRGQVAGWALVDPAQRHPIIVSQQPQTMSLRVPRGSSGLAPQQRAELLAFADRSRASDAGNSRLVIAAPSGSSNEVAAMHSVGEIRTLLSERGFDESSIAVEAYAQDGGSHEPPIKISYLRYVAEGPECGQWPENLAYNPTNLPHPNMGCATQRNLAAMVANPADLLGPRTSGQRSSERRDVAFDAYVKGEQTAAKKSQDEKVSTSNSDKN